MYLQQLYEYLFYRDLNTNNIPKNTPWYKSFKKPDGYKNINSSSIAL